MGENVEGHARRPRDNYYRTLNTFVKSQVRLLETPFLLPENWRSIARRAQREGESHQPQHHREPIPDHVVSAGVKKLNATTQKALRLNFSSQSIHQLLEQLASNQQQIKRRQRQGGIVVRTKSKQELLETSWIDAFPLQWMSDATLEATSADQQQGERQPSSSSSTSALTPTDTLSNAERARQYQELRAQIVELQQKYRVIKEKHEYYKNLRNEIQLLDAGRLQANVVGPNTPISQELAKMKELVPRLISILEVRKETLITNRKRELESLFKDQPEDRARAKRLHTEPTDPMETMLSLLQD